MPNPRLPYYNYFREIASFDSNLSEKQWFHHNNAIHNNTNSNNSNNNSKNNNSNNNKTKNCYSQNNKKRDFDNVSIDIKNIVTKYGKINVDQMTVNEIKCELRLINQYISGNKTALISRLLKYYDVQARKDAPHMPPKKKRKVNSK